MGLGDCEDCCALPKRWTLLSSSPPYIGISTESFERVDKHVDGETHPIKPMGIPKPFQQGLPTKALAERGSHGIRRNLLACLNNPQRHRTKEELSEWSVLPKLSIKQPEEVLSRKVRSVSWWNNTIPGSKANDWCLRTREGFNGTEQTDIKDSIQNSVQLKRGTWGNITQCHIQTGGH